MASEAKKAAAARPRPDSADLVTPDPLRTTSLAQSLPMGTTSPGVTATPVHNGGALPAQYTMMMPPDEDMPDATASIAGMEAVSSRPAPDNRHVQRIVFSLLDATLKRVFI